MKNLLFAVAFLLTTSAMSQDLITTHGGNNMQVKVLAVNENSISYTFPGETVTNTIGKAAVNKVKYASGREETISDKVDVSGEEGWQHVIITNNPNEVIGLKRKGEVKGKAGGYWGMRTVKGADKKATERIKKDAIEMGAHVVFIQQHETTGRKMYYSNPESIQSGTAYGY
ncbi:hypothetical protein [Dyadobacter psychrotolerans]|uniref:Uncharacterized protein n=1 Tax=Dyadobacter psychrotolerans TaxID=2541721 RepID=A0A4R5DW82_9BACT|nr:hypothetical protein [Dyadobacter psychrotolerans]TDE15283.1 hypothetical protein E0F88_12225 [Dyadobacter psychrotolerans]